MLKKLLLFFAALCCTILVGAESITVGGINYNITSPTEPYTVEVGSNTSYSGTTVTIPSSVTFDNITYSVTGIGESAFDGRTNLTSVTIPASVKSIGTYAFWNNGLTSVTFAEGSQLTSIGMNAFSNCSALTSIDIPNYVTSIGAFAFLGCSGLTSVTFAEGSQLKSIGTNAFSYCSGLTSIDIPNSVESIELYAFQNCSNLKDVTVNWTEETKIPAIDDKVFKNVDLSNVTLHYPDSKKSLYQKNDVWKDFGNMLEIPSNEIWYTSSVKIDGLKASNFGENSSITSHDFSDDKGVITFSGDVTSIGAQAFKGCSSLTRIILPNSLESIGDYAFSSCSGLTSITIPASVTSIGKNAFQGCSSLTSINIPSSVESIGEVAFDGCRGLTSVTIPNSVISIGVAAFRNCSSLTSIIIESENTIYDNRDNCNAIIETATNTLVAGCKNTIIPNSVTSIGKNAFQGCSSLTSISIPNSVTSIGNYAFKGCSSLTSIILPNSVTSIGENAFSYCSALESITFKSLPSIDIDAFYDCNHLSDVILDLTDSEKPYIGTSLDNYPSFTEASYTRSSAKDKWGTIVLPFAPASIDGLEFYIQTEMTTANNALTFTKVDNVEAGVPYLFRNVSESADFTLTKANPDKSDFKLLPCDVNVNGATMKGCFQSVQLNTTENPNGNLYYLKDNEFYHANTKLNFSPFRAYIEGDGAALSKGFLLMIEPNVGDVNAVPGIMDDKGEIDETEGIYDLNGRRLTAPLKGQFNIIRTKSGKSIKKYFER